MSFGRDHGMNNGPGDRTRLIGVQAYHAGRGRLKYSANNRLTLAGGSPTGGKRSARELWLNLSDGAAVDA